jgi:hypothetical protein
MQFRYPLSIDDWLGVLEIAQKYLIDIAIQQAVDAPTSPRAQAELSPGAQLRICWEFNLSNLYDRAITEVLNVRPFPGCSVNDYHDLGPELATQVQEIYRQASTARLMLITYIPPFQHSQVDCSGPDTQRQCEFNWREAYGAFTRFLCHTERFYSGRAVLDKFARENIQGMNPICKSEMVEKMRGAFLKEEVIFAEGKATILLFLQGNCPSTLRRRFSPA